MNNYIQIKVIVVVVKEFLSVNKNLVFKIWIIWAILINNSPFKII